MRPVALVFLVGCHAQRENTVTIPAASGSAPSASIAVVASASASASAPGVTVVTAGAETHFKNGGQGSFDGATFTVRMLPKLIVSGPEPEIEQAQIDVTRGAAHGTIQVDTRNKRAEWGGIVFELDYADVYHDDIELTVRRK